MYKLVREGFKKFSSPEIWTRPNLSLHFLYSLCLQIFCLSVAAALPVEDTVEVQQARSNFMAAFAAAESGDHAMLAPVNNDVQAPQIANAYIADTEDVMKAKEDFDVVFKNVEAGGLAEMQAPAPEGYSMPEMKTPMVYSHHMPYYNMYHHNLVYPTTHLTYNAMHPVTYAGLHPVNYAATYPYTYTLPLQYMAPVKSEE